MHCNSPEILFQFGLNNFIGTFIAHSLNHFFDQNAGLVFAASKKSTEWDCSSFDDAKWRRADVDETSKSTTLTFPTIITTTRLVPWFYHWLANDFIAGPNVTALDNVTAEEIPSDGKMSKVLIGLLCKQLYQAAKHMQWDLVKQVTQTATNCWLRHITTLAYELNEADRDCMARYRQSYENDQPPNGFFSLSFRASVGLAAYAHNVQLIRLTLIRTNAKALQSSNSLKQIWQSQHALDIMRILNLSEESEDECQSEHLRYFQLKAARHAEEGARARHRHGACLILNVERCIALTANEELKSKLASLTARDRLLTLGRNTELYTRGWKRHNAEHKKDDDIERWKIIHAEIAALIHGVRHPLVRGVLLSETGASDFEWANLTDDEQLAFLSDDMVECLRLMREEKETEWRGCLSIMVAELDDNGIHFCPSQACPLCVKGLKRWGIGSQTYTTGTFQLLRTEPVTWDPQIVCESLRSSLIHFASEGLELPRKRRTPSKKGFLLE